eukprot:2733-Chlamydomonas_euryale.AAC.1
MGGSFASMGVAIDADMDPTSPCMGVTLACMDWTMGGDAMTPWNCAGCPMSGGMLAVGGSYPERPLRT